MDITKNIRIENQLSKDHRVDALCITGKPNVERTSNNYLIKQVRKRNRQIHQCAILKGGKRKLNQLPYLIFGFRLFDKVQYENKECFIFARRTSGSFELRLLDGTKLYVKKSYKKLKLLEKRQTLLYYLI